MPQITFVPGPIDALNEGLRAGLQIANQKSRLTQARLANKIGQGELQVAIQRVAIERQLAQSQIDIDQQTIFRNRLENETALRFLEQHGVAKELAGVEATTKGTQATTAATKTGRQADLADAVSGALLSFGDKPTMAGAVSLAESMGADPRIVAPMILSDFLNDEKQFELEREIALTNAAHRRILGLAAATTAAGTLSPENRLDLSRAAKLNEDISFNRLLISTGRGTPETKIILEKLEAEFKKLEGRVRKEKGLKETPRLDRSKQLEIEPISGLPIVNNDADFAKVTPGTWFVDSDGESFFKPR